jgi:GTP pyrophosphokinase/guanosine-3',5'-bis(diphosphate) 3'-pyrophosphohydrolase
VQVLENGGDAEELVEHAKLEMYLDQVFVFTPKGALVSLPRGAMPLDFAYALHTDIGDTCIGVKINGELKPLRTILQNGDVVEVIRGGKPVVPPDWRSLTVTGRARSAIRRHIRQSEKEEFIRLGRAAVDQIRGRRRKSRSARWTAGVPGTSVLRRRRGRVAPPQVLDTGLKAPTARPPPPPPHRGQAGQALRARRPTPARPFRGVPRTVPGDRIVGIWRRRRGRTVHTIDPAAGLRTEGVQRDLSVRGQRNSRAPS